MLGWLIPLFIITLLGLTTLMIHFIYYYPHRDTDNRRGRNQFSNDMNIVTLIAIGVDLAYAVLTFELACTDLSLSFSASYSTSMLYEPWLYVQYTILFFDFGPALIIHAYQGSAHYSFWFSLWRALRREASFYGICVAALLIFAIISFAVMKAIDYDTLLGLLLTLKNSIFTVFYVIMIGYSLAEVPRQVLFSCFPVLKLNWLRFQALRVMQQIVALQRHYTNDIKFKLTILREHIHIRIQDSKCRLEQFNLNDKDRANIDKTHISYQKLHRYVEHALAVTARETKMLTKQNVDMAQTLFLQKEPVETDESERKYIQKVHKMSSYSFHCAVEEILCDLKLSIARVIREVQLLTNMQIEYKKWVAMRDIEKGGGSNWDAIYYMVFRRMAWLGIFIIVSAFSLIIIVSNFMLINGNWATYSPLYWLMVFLRNNNTVDDNNVPAGIYIVIGLCSAYLIYGLNQSRIFSFYKIAKNNGTDHKSFAFHVNRQVSMMFVLCWNVATLLNINQNTALFKTIGPLQRIPIFGISILTYLPVAIVVVFLFFLFHIERLLVYCFSDRSFQHMERNALHTLKSQDAHQGKAILEKFSVDEQLNFEVQQVASGKAARILGSILDRTILQ